MYLYKTCIYTKPITCCPYGCCWDIKVCCGGWYKASCVLIGPPGCDIIGCDIIGCDIIGCDITGCDIIGLDDIIGLVGNCCGCWKDWGFPPGCWGFPPGCWKFPELFIWWCCSCGLPCWKESWLGRAWPKKRLKLGYTLSTIPTR